MEFRAYLIKGNSSPGINTTLVGVIIILLSIFAVAFPVSEKLGYLGMGLGFLLAIVGLVMGRGKGLFEVDGEMITIDERSIHIRRTAYPLNEIFNLQFYFHSYYSQSPFGYFTEHSGLIEYGMYNRISFKTSIVEVEEMFYLANKEQADLFFHLMALLKVRGINYSYTCRPFRT